MSIAIRAGKQRPPMGDPGLFGFLGGAISKVTGVASKLLPGPLGSAAGLVSNLAGKLGNKPRVMPGMPSTLMTVPTGPVMMNTQQNQLNLPTIPSVSTLRDQLFGKPQGQGTAVTPYKPSQTDMSGLTTPPPGPGYRPNRSGYWRRDPRDASGNTAIWIPPRSIWVKSRRRNPLNPRAADRAISRLTSAKRAATKLNQITIRKPKCTR